MKEIDHNKKIKFIERSDCILHKESHLQLFRLFDTEKSQSKKILKSIAIAIDTTIICDDFIDSVLFKKELENFNYADDSNNKFFKFLSRKVDGLPSKKLKIKIENQTIYYSKQEAEAIVYAWNTALLGCSLIILAENHSFSKILKDYVEIKLKTPH